MIEPDITESGTWLFRNCIFDQEIEDTLPVHGPSIVSNCGIGHGIKFVETETGLLKIEVDPEPPYATQEDCVALRKFMEETAVRWLQQVAPHRLTR